MKRSFLLNLFLSTFLLTTTFACNSETTSPDFSSAVVGAGGESGKLNITLNTASASVKINEDTNNTAVTATVDIGGTITPLTGTYNSNDNTVTLSGGNYSFTGETTTDGKISGSYTNASGTGLFSGFDSKTDTVIVYCGTYLSDNCTDPNCSGTWNITTSSAGRASGTYLGNGGQGGILWGTFSGNSFSGVDDEGSVCTGTIVDGKVTGTWELRGTTGSFEATVCP